MISKHSKNKTRIDVERCLVKTFEYIGGVPKEILTDNMSSIVNTQTCKFCNEFISFAKDMGTFAKNCKPRHPYTKGKDESANRFMSWLIPYKMGFKMWAMRNIDMVEVKTFLTKKMQDILKSAINKYELKD